MIKGVNKASIGGIKPDCWFELIGNYRDLVMVFNATFNNISAISWQSVLLVEETGVPGENHCAESLTNFIT
jgi:hypothetical protein